MKKWSINSKGVLISCFLGLPILLSVLIVWLFDTLLDIAFVEKFILISGYLFTTSSLLLVFILFKKFSVSDYKKAEVSRIFLEKHGFDELHLALETIKNCVDKNKFKNLSASCTMVRNIHNSLLSYEPGTEIELKAYQNQIKPVVNLINRYGLSSINNANEVERLKKIRKGNKRDFVKKIDDLIWQIDTRKRSRLDEK